MNDPNEEIFDQIQNDRKHISKNIRYLKKFKELKAKNHQLQKLINQYHREMVNRDQQIFRILETLKNVSRKRYKDFQVKLRQISKKKRQKMIPPKNAVPP